MLHFGKVHLVYVEARAMDPCFLSIKAHHKDEPPLLQGGEEDQS